MVLESVRRRALKRGSLIEGAPFNYAGQGQESTRARVFNLPMINVYILSIVGVVVASLLAFKRARETTNHYILSRGKQKD